MDWTRLSAYLKNPTPYTVLGIPDPSATAKVTRHNDFPVSLSTIEPASAGFEPTTLPGATDSARNTNAFTHDTSYLDNGIPEDYAADVRPESPKSRARTHSSADSETSVESDGVDFCWHCGRGNKPKELIQCDLCASWIHLSCYNEIFSVTLLKKPEHQIWCNPDYEVCRKVFDHFIKHGLVDPLTLEPHMLREGERAEDLLQKTPSQAIDTGMRVARQNASFGSCRERALRVLMDLARRKNVTLGSIQLWAASFSRFGKSHYRTILDEQLRILNLSGITLSDEILRILQDAAPPTNIRRAVSRCIQTPMHSAKFSRPSTALTDACAFLHYFDIVDSAYDLHCSPFLCARGPIYRWNDPIFKCTSHSLPFNLPDRIQTFVNHYGIPEDAEVIPLMFYWDESCSSSGNTSMIPLWMTSALIDPTLRALHKTHAHVLVSLLPTGSSLVFNRKDKEYTNVRKREVPNGAKRDKLAEILELDALEAIFSDIAAMEGKGKRYIRHGKLVNVFAMVANIVVDLKERRIVLGLRRNKWHCCACYEFPGTSAISPLTHGVRTLRADEEARQAFKDGQSRITQSPKRKRTRGRKTKPISTSQVDVEETVTDVDDQNQPTSEEHYFDEEIDYDEENDEENPVGSGLSAADLISNSKTLRPISAKENEFNEGFGSMGIKLKDECPFSRCSSNRRVFMIDGPSEFFKPDLLHSRDGWISRLMHMIKSYLGDTFISQSNLFGNEYLLTGRFKMHVMEKGVESFHFIPLCIMFGDFDISENDREELFLGVCDFLTVIGLVCDPCPGFVIEEFRQTVVRCEDFFGKLNERLIMAEKKPFDMTCKLHELFHHVGDQMMACGPPPLLSSKIFETLHQQVFELVESCSSRRLKDGSGLEEVLLAAHYQQVLRDYQEFSSTADKISGYFNVSDPWEPVPLFVPSSSLNVPLGSSWEATFTGLLEGIGQCMNLNDLRCDDVDLIDVTLELFTTLKMSLRCLRRNQQASLVDTLVVPGTAQGVFKSGGAFNVIAYKDHAKSNHRVRTSNWRVCGNDDCKSSSHSDKVQLFCSSTRDDSTSYGVPFIFSRDRCYILPLNPVEMQTLPVNKPILELQLSTSVCVIGNQQIRGVCMACPSPLRVGAGSKSHSVYVFRFRRVFGYDGL